MAASTNSKAFLERYFTEVGELLNDPSFSLRTTPERKLRMLTTHEAALWERFLSASTDAVIGMAEANITIENGKRFYPLPGNFRKFIRLEKRLNDDPNQVLSILPTKAVHNDDVGIILITAQRGFELDPIPILSEDQTWVLIYHKGPVKHHYGVAASVLPYSLTAGETSQGTLVRVDNFYAGSLLKIFDADLGAPQYAEVISYLGKPGAFQFRFALNPVPTGTVWYETVPALDEGLDSLYAYDTAMAVLASRKQIRQRSLLMNTRMEIYQACLNQFTTLTSDRGPERTLPFDPNEPSTGTEVWA